MRGNKERRHGPFQEQGGLVHNEKKKKCSNRNLIVVTSCCDSIHSQLHAFIVPFMTFTKFIMNW